MIPLELIYHSDLIEIEINEAYRYFQVVWLQHPPSREAFQRETRISADYAIAYQANKALFDVRKRFYLDIAEQLTDQKWLEKEIAPLYKDMEGLRAAYLVTQTDYEIMYTAQMHGLILDRSELFKHIGIGVFLDIKEAQDWLLSC